MSAEVDAAGIPDRYRVRWAPHRYHAQQAALYHGPERFKVAAAGRRSGKTVIALRKLVRSAMSAPVGIEDPSYFYAAPTHQQARRIAWRQLKRMIPAGWRDGRPRESDLTIRLRNGAEIVVFGLDKPERAEGVHFDGGILDEYGNMRPEVWTEHIRPTLSTVDRPPGWAWFIGTPEGRNHFWDLFREAGERENWAAYTWKSADILDAAEIAEARRDLDPQAFAQEYEAEFLSPKGLIYYGFSDENIRAFDLPMGARGQALNEFHVGADFNVYPMAWCVGWEEQDTAYVWDEIFLESADTLRACEEMLVKLRQYDHRLNPDRVTFHPDATGRRRQTSQSGGKTDWHIIKGEGFRINGRTANPPVRDRYNAVNTRLLSGDGRRRLIVHPRCKHVIKSLEGASYTDEKGDLSHMADGLGYWIERSFPVVPLHSQLQGIRF